jgi:hypothetical protein
MAKIMVGTVYKDTIDDRDYLSAKLIKDLRFSAVPLPEEYDPPTLIYNQGQKPKCAASSACGVKTDEEYAESGRLIKFDDDYVYARCKERDGIPHLPGTYPRIACKVLKELGVPEVASGSCPFAFLKPKPPAPTPEETYRNRIDAYYRITTSDIDELIKQIIFQFHSIMVASTWYKEWNNAREVFPDPRTPDQPHAYKFSGWKRNGWVTPNSWGTVLWGIKGKSVMPFTMFRDVVLPEGDVWKLVDFIGEIR